VLYAVLAVLAAQLVLFLQGRRIMAAVDDLKAILVRIDKATTDIAEDIATIKAKIVPGMSEAEVAEVQAGLEAAAARLEALDAENPEGQA